MATTCLTRNAFLKAISAIYLIAFLSLYLQIPGLYGPGGVAPAHTQLVTNGTSRAEAIAARPSLVWLAAELGLGAAHAMELLALAGTVLALLGLLFERCRVSLVFGLMLVFYCSLVQVGQVFLFFQWDTLLMEAGLVAALLAPSLPTAGPLPTDALGLWLARWLLFRLVFSTGVVKLLSHCPSWWGLTALEVHFESQCMPTPLARFAHHLPAGLLRLSTVFSLVSELAVPFLFFAPVRRLRVAAFYVQVFLQVMVMATGSFSFYNLLVVALCLSLVDDGWLSSARRGREAAAGWMTSLMTWGVLGALLAATAGLFQLRVGADGVTANIAFSKEEFAEFVHAAVPAGIVLAFTSLLLTVAETLTSAVMDSAGCCHGLNNLLRTLTVALVATAVFFSSLVPYTMLDAATHRALPAPLRAGFADHVQPFHVFGSYGLFRQMTGVGGRPEVVLEGANSLQGPWQEIEFRYKPGDVTTVPRVVFPHQPRLDWQMWLAALGDYHANPWLTALAYRLLTAQPEVLRLLDTSRYPFTDKPPKYVRGLRYKYHYTSLPSDKHDGENSWWRRDPEPEEYLPIFSADHKPLLEYLRELNIIDNPEHVTENPALVGPLEKLRTFFDQWEPSKLLWAVLLACWLVNITRGRLR